MVGWVASPPPRPRLGRTHNERQREPVRVVMLEDRVAAVDGVRVEHLRAGQTVDVSQELGKLYLERGFATEDTKALKQAPENKALKQAPENKAEAPKAAAKPTRRRRRAAKE